MKDLRNIPIKKRILLLSYYFSPCSYVAANRPVSFTKELLKNNAEVIVVTRHWTGKEQIWEDYLKSDLSPLAIEKRGNLTIHRLPYQKPGISKFKPLSKLQVLLKQASGRLNNDIDYYQFKSYIKNLLEKQSIDLILVSVPPLNILRLGHELSKKHHKKLLVDVRDFQNHIVLNKSARIKMADKIKHFFILHYSMKWFKTASLIFTITPQTTRFIGSRTGNKTITIMNGFEEKLLSINEKEYPDFHITLMGSLYEIPEFELLLRAFKNLFQHDFAHQIKIQLIGSATSPAITAKVKAAIPAANLLLKPRMAQEDAQKEAAKSQILLVLGFKNMRGVLGTKPFEYLGLRKNILQMPGDKDLMEKIILECRAGRCPSSEDEFVHYIKEIFHEWKAAGKVKYHGDLSVIQQYSREEQFKKLLPYILE